MVCKIVPQEGVTLSDVGVNHLKIMSIFFPLGFRRVPERFVGFIIWMVVTIVHYLTHYQDISDYATSLYLFFQLVVKLIYINLIEPTIQLVHYIAMIFQVITQLLLIQQLLTVVESFSTIRLRFPTIPSYMSRSSTVNDSPTISFIGKKPLARATINLRDIEFTVVSSAILSVSYDTVFHIILYTFIDSYYSSTIYTYGGAFSLLLGWSYTI